MGVVGRKLRRICGEVDGRTRIALSSLMDDGLIR
jgi:hypothetical protein